MTEFRLKVGTVTAANINADSASVVGNWSGATNGYPWSVESSGIVRPYVERLVSLAGDSQSGLLNFEWQFTIINDTQYQTIVSTTGQYVTAKTRNRPYSATVASQWVVINCFASAPEITDEGLNPVNDQWFSTVIVRFREGSYAAAS